MIGMLIQLYQLLQISALVTTACIGDGALSIGLWMGQWKADRIFQEQQEELLAHKNLIPLPSREIRMLDNKGYLHDPRT